MYPCCFFVFVILLHAVENKGSPTWPYGQYTLLKPRTGCPDGWDDKGYLYQDTIDKNPRNNRSGTLHIDGKVACSHVKKYFCSKTDTVGTLWPSGQYCAYRSNHKKLHRMRKGSILMYGERNNNQDEYNLTKVLVDVEKSGVIYQYTRLYFACQTRGNKKIPISLPIAKPFYLLPYGSRDCQQVRWMVATSEWIKYHTRNRKKRGKQTYGTVPYHELGDKNHKGITMYYCYYKSCNYTLYDTEGVFQSPGFPGKYPDGQLCSWKIMVPENHTLRVRFTHFSLGTNDTLRYSKTINGSIRSWYTITFSMLPFTLSFDIDVLFVFRSDEANTSTGFRAEYRVFIPQDTISLLDFTDASARITASTEAPTTVTDVSTQSTISTTPSSKTKTPTTKPLSSTLRKDTKSMKISTSQQAPQYGKSNAETLKDSIFSNRNLAIIVIGVPAVCLLFSVVLLIVIIYQCRVRRTRDRASNPKRDKEEADCPVMNPTYEREANLLTSPNETATANIGLNGGDDSCVAPECENNE